VRSRNLKQQRIPLAVSRIPVRNQNRIGPCFHCVPIVRAPELGGVDGDADFTQTSKPKVVGVTCLNETAAGVDLAPLISTVDVASK
jgi:hypothetical protein